VGARVRVLLAPTRSTAPRPGAGECAVVVDVLRATTTLTVALGHGALRVLAAATPEQASALRAGHPGALLCGERGGLRIDGFDLGNSPFEYPVPVVAGRTLIFASTNGSQALLAAAAARRRLLAAFVNARAVVERLAGERAVVIVCAGSSGRFAIEDAGCAGLLCERLAALGATLEGSAAALARALAPRDARAVRALVQGSSHGRELRAMGAAFARDVEFCAELDALDQAFDVSP
jgi:2-phosphosulfolactate phosphatase